LGQVHDLHDFRRIRLRQGTAKHGEVLRKHINQAALNAPVAGDEPIPVILLVGHAEVVAAMRHELVGFLERSLIEQEINSFPRRHFAFFVLPFPPLRSAAFLGEPIALLQFVDFLFDIHGGRIICAEEWPRL